MNIDKRIKIKELIENLLSNKFSEEEEDLISLEISKLAPNPSWSDEYID